jgi:uncharacterized protein
MEHYLFKKYEKNSWKRFVLSSFIIILFTIIGIIGYVIVTFLLGPESSYLDEATGEFVGLDPLFDFMFSHVIYIGMFVGIWIAVRFVHKRSITSLITASSRVNWNQIWWGFGIYFGLFTVFTFVDFMIFPNHYSVNVFNFSDFLLLFVIVLILVPIQTTVEELIFRGFLLQWFAKKLSNPIILSLIIAVIFGSLHFANPEMDRSVLWIGLNYVFVGFMLTFIAVKMGSLELSIGVHAANNMLLSWFLADSNSVNGNIPAIFRMNDDSPVFSLLWSICIFAIFYIMSMRKYKGKGTRTKK